MKRLFSFLILLLFLSFFLTGCQPKAKNTKKTLTIALSADPTSLDPRKRTDLCANILVRMLYEGLMRMDQKGQPTFGLAKAVSVSSDKKTYTFTLRNAYWSDGSKVTAHDFERTWKEILEHTFPSHDSYKLFVIKNAKLAKEGKISTQEVGVKAICPKKLRVELEYPVPYFLELVSLPAFFATASDNPKCYNGPFVLNNWDHHHHLSFQKNTRYWDQQSVKLDQIDLQVIPDENTALSLFESNTIDWIGQPFTNIPLDALDTIREKYTIQTKPIAATCWLVFNSDAYPFHNENLRKALSLAMNREKLIKEVTNSLNIPAFSAIPDTGSYKHKTLFHEDYQLANRLLNKALGELNVSKNELKIQFEYPACEINHRLAQALQQQWYKVLNLEVSLIQNDIKTHFAHLRGKEFQVARASWFADFSDPVSFLDLYKYKINGTNYPSWENPTFTKLIDDSVLEDSMEKRNEIYQNAEKILISEMPLSPIYFYTYSFLCDTKLKNFVVSSIGEVDFKWAYFEEN